MPNTLILSRHEPSIEYIQDELNLDPQEVEVREQIEEQELDQLQSYEQVVGNAPLWLIREMNRQGVEYRGLNFKKRTPRDEEITKDNIQQYEPMIEPYTVLAGRPDDFKNVIKQAERNEIEYSDDDELLSYL